MEFLVIAFLTAVSFFIIMAKIGMGKFVKMGWIADFLISFVMVAMFFGTFGGVVVGILAGIFISLFLSLAKLFGRMFTPGD